MSEIELRTIVGEDAATAELVVDGTTFVGTSKRHPDDPHIPAVGEQLAVARALRAASDHFRRRAYSGGRHIIEWSPLGFSIEDFTRTLHNAIRRDAR